MSQERKIETLLRNAVSDDLSEYMKLLKVMKKRMPFFKGTSMIAAELLKEYLGDISSINYAALGPRKHSTGEIIFEDVKDGRARLFINVGKNQRINPGDLIREIVKRSGIDGKLIGKIDIHPAYSFFEVPEQFAEMVLLSFDNVKLRGVSVKVQPAKRRKPKAESNEDPS